MTSESGAMRPLAVPVKTSPWVRSPSSRSAIIEATWDRLVGKMEEAGVSGSEIDSARAAFVGGVYASAAAVLNERAHCSELSKAAWRIENDADR